ncbi:MAG: sulfatase-like hydrolase/transferase [Firmicutes bacterium]|nr:sulfatase-like hydrolase/transferase [Bacillota bacterium]
MKEKLRSFSEKYNRAIRILYFPVLISWLELVLHAFDRAPARYAPVYIIFSISIGFLVSAFINLTEGRRSYIIMDILSGIVTLIFMAEFVAKKILQTYYPPSSLETAAGNKLYEFIGIIVQTVLKALPMLIVMVLPFVFSIVYHNYIYVDNVERKHKKLTSFALSIGAFVLAHLLGLAALNLPYSGDLTPAKLYRMDVNYNDQVEQLGLLTMIRIDVRNTLFGVEHSDEFDPSIIGGDSYSTSSAIDAKPVEEEPDPIDTSPNIMDVDLAALAESASNSNVKWLANYFNAVEPTRKNEYTGMFEGYNVIFITIESFSSYAVSEQYTPTLYKLLNEGFVFDNFYTALHFTSTSNGECQHLLGLYPKNGQPISMVRTGQLRTNCYFSLAQQLGRLGYKNYGYHNNWDLYERNNSHSNVGYDWKWCGAGVPYEKTASGDLKWPQRDSYMIEQTCSEFIDQDEPFNVYYLTVSGHTPYSWNWVCEQYREELADAPYSEETKAYIATVMEADRAIKLLIDKLDEAGKLDNTLIVAAGDHVPYTGVEILEELADKQFGTSEAVRNINESDLDFEVYRNGLIIWNPNIEETVHVKKVCCQVDILPTLSNLLGLTYDSRMLSGTDIFSTSDGMVVFSSRCFRTDKGFYNRFTQEFTLNPGVEMNDDDLDEYVEKVKAIAGYRLDCTNRLIESDFYNVVFGSEDRIWKEPTKY